MKRFKRVLLLLLLVGFVLSLCGCSEVTQVVGNAVGSAVSDALGSSGTLELDSLQDNETIQALLGKGLSLKELFDEGFSIDELLGEGFSVDELLGSGLSVQDFLGEGFDLGELLNGGASLSSLLNGGIDLGSLLSEGVSEDALLEAGVTQDELDEALAAEAEAASEPESSVEPEAEETPEPTEAPLPEPSVTEDGWYTTKEDVAEYLRLYRKLPGNFIRKNDAKEEYGWEGGSLPENRSIGGDRFGNYEGLLPEGYTYTECDIDTMGAKSRGAKRIVFTITEDEIRIYYTDDHYESFSLLYEETT